MVEKRRVLIVEDDPGTSNLLAQVVERAGYEPVRVRGAQEGLALLRKEKIDLLLLDLMMRDMDGWTMLKIIKADGDLAALPVVIVSARHPREDPAQTEAYATWIEDYMVKPFEVGELMAKLAEILG